MWVGTASMFLCVGEKSLEMERRAQLDCTKDIVMPQFASCFWEACKLFIKAISNSISCSPATGLQRSSVSNPEHASWSGVNCVWNGTFYYQLERADFAFDKIPLRQYNNLDIHLLVFFCWSKDRRHLLFKKYNCVIGFLGFSFSFSKQNFQGAYVFSLAVLPLMTGQICNFAWWHSPSRRCQKEEPTLKYHLLAPFFEGVEIFLL